MAILNFWNGPRGMKRGSRRKPATQLCLCSKEHVTKGKKIDKMYWQLYIYWPEGLVQPECLFRAYSLVRFAWREHSWRAWSPFVKSEKQKC